MERLAFPPPLGPLTPGPSPERERGRYPAAPFALGGAFLEGEMVPLGVVLGWRRVAEQPAEVDEMLLRGLALGQRCRLPFADEVLRVTGSA